MLSKASSSAPTRWKASSHIASLVRAVPRLGQGFPGALALAVHGVDGVDPVLELVLVGEVAELARPDLRDGPERDSRCDP